MSDQTNPEEDQHARVVVVGPDGVAMEADAARPSGRTVAFLESALGNLGAMLENDAAARARLQSAAPVDGILVGWATYQATAGAIEYEPAEAVRAKGKARPVQAWPVRGARSRIPDLLGAGYTRLVDRAAERRTMLEAFERSRVDRSPRAVLLIGDPGIGKTRLVAELAERNDRRPELIRWRLGRSFPYGEPSPFAALT